VFVLNLIFNHWGHDHGDSAIEIALEHGGVVATAEEVAAGLDTDATRATRSSPN
jgi:hypothetical protein